jgi:transposase-like protein
MKKISNEEYQNLFIRWQESGISKAEFASREDLSKNAFYYWCRKFEEGNAPADLPGFTHIGSVPGFQKEPFVRINYPSGVSIEFFGQVSPDSIKNLL